MESFLIGNERNRSHIAELWFKWLINLNNKIGRVAFPQSCFSPGCISTSRVLI